MFCYTHWRSEGDRFGHCLAKCLGYTAIKQLTHAYVLFCSLSLSLSLSSLSLSQGYHWAQNWLGICYNYGFGTPQDYTKSFEYLEKAVEQGNSVAMTKLGYCYETGEGCNQNILKAIDLYERSACLGDSSAMTYLGNCYENGVGVHVDVEAAKEWYVKASAQGNRLAQSHLDAINGKESTWVDDAGKQQQGGDNVQHIDTGTGFWNKISI